MKRVIKFRGKRIDNGKWIYGYLSDVDKTPIGNLGNINSRPFGDVEESTLVKAETIGQFTGMLDKNGKEIYEGDIIKYTRYNLRSEYIKVDVIEDNYVVYWSEKKHAFYCTTKFESGGGSSGYLVFHDERAEKEEIEIIGNIYDNKEVLNGKP